MDVAAQLNVLQQLLRIGRPGALFPDVRRLHEWLELSRPGKNVPKVELHPLSGFPTRPSLLRLLERQKVAKAFFEAHHTKAPKHAEVFHTALAAAELWAPQVEAKVMSRTAASLRLLVTLDRFDEKKGTLVRFTVQLALSGTKHARVDRNEACVMTGPFLLAVEEACDASTTAAALRLAALEGVTVEELTRAELGPCYSAVFPIPGPMADLARTAVEQQGVLSMLLERVGQTVAADFSSDAWPEPDALKSARAAKGWHLSRERKLICSPALEAAAKQAVTGTRMLVRCR